jgi:putative DNA methylase
MITHKKLIEVALPLEAINKASAREKSIRHGHPSTLHLWWARRPLAAARAVIFAQMVDDPSSYVDTLKSDPKLLRQAGALLKGRLKRWEEAAETAEKAHKAGISAPEPGPKPELDDILAEVERNRLFGIIEKLVQWENTTNETVLQQAREEIWQSWRRTCAENADHPRAKELFDRKKLPAFHDPFAGGGALPLEAQRLGLEAYASDLNPVAVLINKAMIEIPPMFAGKPPVNPDAREGQLGTKTWKGTQGLAEDVRYYGQWMRDEAERRIGHLYPKIEVTAEMAKERPDLKPLVEEKLTVIAWLWARTVKSPNPAFRTVDVPLASTFMLSTKQGREAWIDPVIEDACYRFKVKLGSPKNADVAKNGTKLARGANFRCIMSDTPIAGDYIKAEGKAGRMSTRLMAIVAEGERGRVFLSPTAEHEAMAAQAKPEWKPDGAFVEDARAFTPFIYGLGEWKKLFTDRQLVALATFADLVQEAKERVQHDGVAAGLSQNSQSLNDGGTGAAAYAEAVALYQSLATSKSADYWSNICTWRSDPKNLGVGHVFARHAIQMTWDYAEGNPFSFSSGNYSVSIDWIQRAVAMLPGRLDRDRWMRRRRRGGSSSLRSIGSFRRPCGICRRAISPQWISRRRPSALAWPYSPVMHRCSTRRGTPSPSAMRLHLSTRRSTLRWQSRKAILIPTAVGHWHGSSSTVSTRGSTVWPRRLARPRIPVYRALRIQAS